MPVFGWPSVNSEVWLQRTVGECSQSGGASHHHMIRSQRRRAKSILADWSVPSAESLFLSIWLDNCTSQVKKVDLETPFSLRLQSFTTATTTTPIVWVQCGAAQEGKRSLPKAADILWVTLKMNWMRSATCASLEFRPFKGSWMKIGKKRQCGSEKQGIYFIILLGIC